MPIPSDDTRPRILITGAEGFVGPYVIRALRQVYHDDLDIIATTYKSTIQGLAEKCELLDVTNGRAVRDIIAGYQPTHIIHLAGLAAPSAATMDSQNVWRVHVGGTINIANAILDAAPRCCLVYIGSGLIYGDSAKSGLPVDEATLLAPVDDYAATKAAADLAMGAFSHRGLHVIRMRPFNHTGPGQTEAFVIPAFAAQVARIECGLMPPVVRVGNLDPQRDFLDVRDVANAYALAVFKSETIESNTVINIASGLARRVGDILDWFLQHSTKNIAIEQDKSRVRPSDLPRIVGNASRARQMLDWAPEKKFDETLSDILADWRSRISQKAATSPVRAEARPVNR
jgi:GDP-4-dehydro-6-deoxy-D-mannose reductase